MNKNTYITLMGLIVFNIIAIQAGEPAARMGDATSHGGSIVAGEPTVLIGGKPAARMGDMHTCPMLTPANVPIPHVGGPISNGSPTVFIGGMPAARVGDMASCTNGPSDQIILGYNSVLIGDVYSQDSQSDNTESEGDVVPANRTIESGSQLTSPQMLQPPEVLKSTAAD